MQNWTKKQIEALKATGKIKGYTSATQLQQPSRSLHQPCPSKISKEKQWIESNIAYWCNAKAAELKEEHKFHPERKWRFDWAIPAFMIAVEYEGLMSNKSRHTTIKGFTGDTDKYNAAQVLGWRVIRLTALNYKSLIQILDSYVLTNASRQLGS
jgi:hypothetical protein